MIGRVLRSSKPIITNQLKANQKRTHSTKNEVLKEQLKIVRKKNSNCPVRLKHAENCLKAALDTTNCKRLLSFLKLLG